MSQPTNNAPNVLDLGLLTSLGSGSGSQYLYAPNLANLLDAGNVFSEYVNNEQQLLNSQTTLVNDAALAKSRQVALNESVRKRTQDYSNMMIVVCIFLGVLLLLAFLKPVLTFIPSVVYDLLIMLIIAGVIIYVFYAVQKIQARDKTDYDTLNLPGPDIPPSDAAAAQAAADAAAKGNLLDASEIEDCAGAACCDDGTRYDITTKRCVPIPPSNTPPTPPVQQGMTTMGEQRGNTVLPYTPSETTQYTFLQ
jgi:hypothetical protein